MNRINEIGIRLNDVNNSFSNVRSGKMDLSWLRHKAWELHNAIEQAETGEAVDRENRRKQTDAYIQTMANNYK